MASSTLTLSEIRTRIRDRLVEQDSGHFTDAQLTSIVNEAQDVFADITHCLFKYWDVTGGSVASQAEYQLPVDCLDVYEVRWGSGSAETKLDPYDWEDLANISATWWTSGGTPTHYFMREDLLGLYPYPTGNATRIRIYGHERPDELSADGDVTPIPDRFQWALVYYPLWQLTLSDENPRSPVYERMWRSMVARARSELWTRQREYLPQMKQPNLK